MRIEALSLGLLVSAFAVGGCSTSTSTPTPGDAPSDGGDDAGTRPEASVEAGPPPIPCGRAASLCVTGEACEGAPDCVSGLCLEGTCRDVSPADGLKDGDETDVDCGGTKAPACADDKACKAASDCVSGVCTGGICQRPTSTDGVKNGDETDVDCGGTTTSAPKCATGKGCADDVDCDNVRCDLGSKKCAAPSHDDLLKNDGETGVDCGGEAPKKCPTGEGCLANDDCDNVLCDVPTATCAKPSASDGLKNGTESDVDCGGGAPTNAPRCPMAKGCGQDADCVSDGCSAALGGKCTLRSCATAETAGIVTCGSGETTDAVNAQESCCRSMTLPTRTTRRLDKYEITAGRFRTFLTKVGPNVRAWVQAYAAASPTSQLGKLANMPILDGTTAPAKASTMLSLYPAEDRFTAHSLTANLVIDIDNYDGIRGCYNDVGSYSANTYWVDAVRNADFGLPPRSLARTISDEKPLNCQMPIMYAAFCAWDGGELALLDDYRDVWVSPPNTYPWGPTDTLRPTYNWCNGPYQNGGFTCQCDGVHNVGSTCPAGGFTGIGEAGVFYEYPRNTNRSKDNSPLIAAPGRIAGDATLAQSEGSSWMDVFANLAEYTGDFSASSNDWCDMSVDPGVGAVTCTRGNRPGQIGIRWQNIPKSGIIGRSWEGHDYGRGSTSGYASTFQYGKFGARCVRPAAPW
jgi:hypothetical protein